MGEGLENLTETSEKGEMRVARKNSEDRRYEGSHRFGRDLRDR